MQSVGYEYSKFGYVSAGLNIEWDYDYKKKVPKYHFHWENAKLDNCVDHYFNANDESITILTGEVSDLYVVDCDLPKEKDRKQNIQDGIEFFNKQVELFGLPEKIMRAKTPSGGFHYMFSLSKSLEHGLESPKNKKKLSSNGTSYTIDTRGDGGNIIVSPSYYMKYDRKMTYKWQTKMIKNTDLDPMPEWLINLINCSSKSKNKNLQDNMIISEKIEKRLSIVNNQPSLQVFMKKTMTVIQDRSDTSISKIWLRNNGYDYSLQDKLKPCKNCGNIHTSNNNMCRRVLDDVFLLKNYSTSCKFELLNWQTSYFIKNIIRSPNSDKTYAELLNLYFKQNDKIMLYTENKKFLCFIDHIWHEIHPQLVNREAILICSNVIDTCLLNIKPEDEHYKKFLKAKAYIDKAYSTDAIVKKYKDMYFNGEIDKYINNTPDILAVKNGVIELKTGQLRDGKQEDYLSKMLDVEYQGVDYPTPDIDAFIKDIFNDDLDVVNYIQKLLGYAVSGNTKEQCWAIFTGTGSNGKSLLVGLLSKLLGSWMRTVPPEIFFQRKSGNAGGHTAHLNTVKSARIALREESNVKEGINKDVIKALTGESSLSNRGAFQQEFEDFEPRCFPLLVCNHKPMLDVYDSAEMRRIVLVPFVNTYTWPGNEKLPYDPENPNHRLIDKDLKEKLRTEECQEQLLTWLVNGAVKWHREGLMDQPALLNRHFEEYKKENDNLFRFIEENCERKNGYCVSAAEFRAEYKKYIENGIKQMDLIKNMQSLGFDHKKDTPVGGTRTNCFIGLKLIKELDIDDLN